MFKLIIFLHFYMFPLGIWKMNRKASTAASMEREREKQKTLKLSLCPNLLGFLCYQRNNNFWHLVLGHGLVILFWEST
jgi:hypothetical protein